MQVTVVLCSMDTRLPQQIVELVTLSLQATFTQIEVELTKVKDPKRVFSQASDLLLFGMVSWLNDWKSNTRYVARHSRSGLCSSTMLSRTPRTLVIETRRPSAPCPDFNNSPDPAPGAPWRICKRLQRVPVHWDFRANYFSAQD